MAPGRGGRRRRSVLHERAAGSYGDIGSRPDEAFSRLQAARQLQEAETLAGRSTSSA